MLPDNFPAQLNYVNVSFTFLSGPVPASFWQPSTIGVSLGNNRNGLTLCNPQMSQTAAFGNLPYCDVTGLSLCGCTNPWFGCAGAVFCPNTLCQGPAPAPYFVCSETGWRSTSSVTMTGNLALNNATYIRGSVTANSITLNGLKARLFLQGCPSVANGVTVKLEEIDLDEILAAPGGITYPLITLPMNKVCQNISVQVTIAPNCKSARWQLITTVDAAQKQQSTTLLFEGFYGSCATWTAPLMGLIHAFIIAVSVAYIVFTYCRPACKK